VKNSVLKMIKFVPLIYAAYKRITDYRLRKKIDDFQTSRFRYFTVATNMPSHTFAQLSAKYGSDKDTVEGAHSPYVWPAHTYGTFYEFMFRDHRSEVKYVFECGIGSNNSSLASNMGEDGKPGASLRLWLEYFPSCKVYAGDIDLKSLITEDRIQSFQLDQTNPQSIKLFWEKIPNIKFELMIDDGLHNVNAGITLLLNSIHKLSPDGIYIIEDVSVNDLETYSKQLSDHDIVHYFVSLHRDKEYGFDNNLIVIRQNEQ